MVSTWPTLTVEKVPGVPAGGVIVTEPGPAAETAAGGRLQRADADVLREQRGQRVRDAVV